MFISVLYELNLFVSASSKLKLELKSLLAYIQFTFKKVLHRVSF